jgi:hypothetical protein
MEIGDPLTPTHATRSNITIPATFVTKSTGDALKALLKGGAAVYVSMDWTDILPKKQQVCMCVCLCVQQGREGAGRAAFLLRRGSLLLPWQGILKGAAQAALVCTV